MKKLLSLLTAAVMLMSVMLSIPTLALGENEGYPLLFETFETEESLKTVTKTGGGNSTISISDGGVNGSAGAAHIVHSGEGYTDIIYPAGGFNISAGQSMDLSVWVNLHSELKKDADRANMISFIFYGKGIVDKVGNRTDVTAGEPYSANGWKQIYVYDILEKDTWVQAKKTIVWDDNFSIGSGASIKNVQIESIAFRIADIKATDVVVDGKPLDYEIDDFILRYTPVEEEEKSSVLADMDFDNSSATGELDGRSEDCSPGYHKVVYTMDQVTPDEPNGYVYNKQANVTVNALPKPGHMYKISGWYRFDLDEAATDYVVEEVQLRMIFMSKDKSDVNFAGNTNYPSYYSKKFSAGEWTKIEYYFYMDYHMYATNPGAYLWMRICPLSSFKGGNVTRVGDHAIPGTYSFDNIQVEDLGAPANGDFELGTDILTVRNFENSPYAIPGWSSSGVDAEVVEENGNHYLTYTTTADNYGSCKTSAFAFCHGKTYQISFRAKTEGLEEGASLPLTMILDRKVDKTGANDSYSIPNYEYLIGDGQIGSAQVKENHPWQLTNEWQTFTTTYKTGSKVIEGMESTAESVNPRAALMYFLVNETSPKGTTLCIDNLVVEETKNIPVVKNISFDVKDNTVFVNYDCNTYPNEPEDQNKTLIRAFIKNGDTETNIGTFAGNEGFTVPVIAVGKTISFEVIPVSVSGIIGESAIADCDTVFDFMISKKLTVNEDVTEGSYHINIADTDSRLYRAAVATYDKNNRMLSVTYDALEASPAPTDFENTFPIPAKAEKIKLMVLDGETLAPIAEATEMLIPINSDPFAGKDTVNVVFLGGSITEGVGSTDRFETSYCALTGKYLKEKFADKKVNIINQGVGGTGSDYGLMRLTRDVISQNPDMVFVEFAVNDGGADKRLEMESIVRTLNNLENPPYIVYLYTTRSTFNPVKSYHAEVGDFYNIPQIDLQAELKREIESTGNDVLVYLPDTTHPSDAGYQVYANRIIECLETGRFYRRPQVTEEKLIAESGVADFEILPATEATASGVWETKDANLNRKCMISSQAGDTLTFRFNGNAFGVELILNDAGGKYDIYIDGKHYATHSCYYKNISYYHCRRGGSNFLLNEGDHTVEIKVLGEKGDANASGCLVGIANVFAGTIER